MRITLKPLSLLSSSAFKVNSKLFRNFVTPVSQQQVTTPSQETLTGRLFLYLNVDQGQPNVPNNTPEVLTTIRKNPKQLYKLNTNELMAVPSTLQNLSKAETERILKELDTEYCLRLSELSPSDIFKLLNVYMSAFPNRIIQFKFYKHAIDILYNSLGSLSSHDVLQLIFYIGLTKKSTQSQTMHRQCIRKLDNKFINNLTSEELCIICNATFKTSTKILNKRLLDRVRSYLNKDLSILKDSALFVTFIKTLRHNRYQNDDLLNTISCTIFFNKTFTFYSFPMSCHIMALFADYFFYDEPLFKLLTKNCLEELSESSYVSKKLHPTLQLRGKDIKRFLWVLSMFSEMKLITHSDIKNVIIPKLMERIEKDEFFGDVDSLIDIILFLWMLNYQAHELVPYVFNKRNWHLLNINPKSKLRLNLLLQTISVENPDLLAKISIKPDEVPRNFSTYQLQKRPMIERLLGNLQRIRKELNLEKFQLSQDIPHLNIIGITGFKTDGKKAVHIEILDNYTKIRNVDDDVPVGLMALKLRLLDLSEHGVLVLSERELEEMTDAELNKSILEELKLIC